MEEKQELKACPFCGGKAYIERAKSTYCQLHGEETKHWRIKCKHKDSKWKDNTNLPECHVKPIVEASSIEKVTKAWNRRA